MRKKQVIVLDLNPKTGLTIQDLNEFIVNYSKLTTLPPVYALHTISFAEESEEEFFEEDINTYHSVVEERYKEVFFNAKEGGLIEFASIFKNQEVDDDADIFFISKSEKLLEEAEKAGLIAAKFPESPGEIYRPIVNFFDHAIDERLKSLGKDEKLKIIISLDIDETLFFYNAYIRELKAGVDRNIEDFFNPYMEAYISKILNNYQTHPKVEIEVFALTARNKKHDEERISSPLCASRLLELFFKRINQNFPINIHYVQNNEGILHSKILYLNKMYKYSNNTVVLHFDDDPGHLYHYYFFKNVLLCSLIYFPIVRECDMMQLFVFNVLNSLPTLLNDKGVYDVSLKKNSRFFNPLSKYTGPLYCSGFDEVIERSELNDVLEKYIKEGSEHFFH